MLFGDEHVRRYEETEGEIGHDWENHRTASVVPCLVLTTTGRRSGEARKKALIYQELEGAYVVVASRGGGPRHPAWYLNLSKNPEVGVQVRGDRFTARARTASADEKAALWPKMVAVWPDYDDYQRETERDIPVVILDRLAA